MKQNHIPQWLSWAREIQALAQTSEHYAENEFQVERYQRLAEISSEIIANHTSAEATELVADFQVQRGYATPKIDVRGAVFKEGKLLMVEEMVDGGWTLPGGWVDVGDVPSESAEREVWEESGYKVKATKVIGVYDANRVGELGIFHAFKLVFLCDLEGGEACTSNETSRVGFFGRDEIPQPYSGERTHQRHIDDAFRVWENPDTPAVFD